MTERILFKIFIPGLLIGQLNAQTILLKETCLTKNTFDDRFASYSPNGEKIIFESNRSGSWDIYLMDADGENQTRLTSKNSDDRHPIWHPKANKILFESNRSGHNELYTIKIKNRKTKKLSNPKLKGEFIFGCFSPNGKNIAVSLKVSEETSNIVLLKKNGNFKKSLTQNNVRNYYPKWSPDGIEIIYFSRKDTQNNVDEIYRLNLKNGLTSRLTNWPKHNFCPSWSPDGSLLTYVTSMEDIRPEIYIMNADGTNKIRVTNNKDGDTLPHWSPGGNKILITGHRDGNYEICELELNMN